MKTYFKKLFKRSRSIEKTVFLLCNTVLLVVIMMGVWKSYDASNGQLVFPPVANAVSIKNDRNYSVNIAITEPIENEPSEVSTKPVEIIEKTTEPTEVIEIDEEFKASPIKHIVCKGDSWYSLSEEYFNTNEYSAAIAYTNERSITDYIFIGETILIEDEETLNPIRDMLDSKYEDEVIAFLKGKYDYSYGTRPNPAIDITIDKDNDGRNYTEEVDTSSFEYAGKHTITGYNPYCSHCCSGTGLMASGIYAINGYSVAAGAYPIGTTLYIEGYGFYVVEDRGVSGNHIDIAAPSHEACYDLTSNGVNVYIVPNNN